MEALRINPFESHVENLPILNFGIALTLIIVSIISLHKLSAINKQGYQTPITQGEERIIPCCEEQTIVCPHVYSYLAATTIDGKSESTAPLIVRKPYQGGPYGLRSRPTPRTEKGWYELSRRAVQRSTRRPNVGEKRKLIKEAKRVMKKKPRTNLIMESLVV